MPSDNPDRGPMCLFVFALLVTVLVAIGACAVAVVR